MTTTCWPVGPLTDMIEMQALVKGDAGLPVSSWWHDVLLPPMIPYATFYSRMIDHTAVRIDASLAGVSDHFGRVGIGFV